MLKERSRQKIETRTRQQFPQQCRFTLDVDELTFWGSVADLDSANWHGGIYTENHEAWVTLEDPENGDSRYSRIL